MPCLKSKDQLSIVTPNSMPSTCKYLISISPESKWCTIGGIYSLRPLDLSECADTRILNEPMLVWNLTSASGSSPVGTALIRENWSWSFFFLSCKQCINSQTCHPLGWVRQKCLETCQAPPYFPNGVSLNWAGSSLRTEFQDFRGAHPHLFSVHRRVFPHLFFIPCFTYRFSRSSRKCVGWEWKTLCWWKGRELA